MRLVPGAPAILKGPKAKAYVWIGGHPVRRQAIEQAPLRQGFDAK